MRTQYFLRIYQLTKSLNLKFSSEPLKESKKRFIQKYKKLRYKQQFENISQNQEFTNEQKQNHQQTQEQINLEQQYKIDILSTPKNLQIRNLHYQPTKSHIVLLGVDKKDMFHAKYINDFMETAQPDLVFLQIPPDMPYFIKTQNSFEVAWEKFTKGRLDYKFFVNPNPESIQEIVLSAENVQALVSGPIMQATSHFEINANYLHQHDHISNKFKINSIMTPLLYSYNNISKNIPIVIGDFPLLKFRHILIENQKTQELKKYFKIFVEEKIIQNPNFDVSLLNMDDFVQPKINYICEVLKQSCYMGKKILAVCDSFSIDFIEEKWKNINQKKLLNLIDLQKGIIKEKRFDEQNTFIDYIEKCVILDLMFEPILKKYFVIHQTFPYQPVDTIGYFQMLQSIFVIWEHYYRQYYKGIVDKKKGIADQLDRKFTDIGTGEESIFVK